MSGFYFDSGIKLRLEITITCAGKSKADFGTGLVIIDRQGLYSTAEPAGSRRQLKHYHELSGKSRRTHYDRKEDLHTANTSWLRRILSQSLI